jgi:hypothetical protein
MNKSLKTILNHHFMEIKGVKHWLLCLLIWYPVVVFAQGHTAQREQQKVLGKTFDGYRATIEADKEKVEKEWIKYLKEFGKVEKSKKMVLLKNAIIFNAISSATIHSQLVQEGKNTRIWWGRSLEEDAGAKATDQDLERLLSEFVLLYLRNEVQNQINEAERAVSFTSKNHQKLLREKSDLENKIERNQQERERLAQEIIDLEAKSVDLKSQLETNGKNLEQTEKDLEKIKEVLETYKLKLLNIR